MFSVLKRAHFRRLSETPLFYEWIRGYCSTVTEVKIQIPKRIERSPTDILEALANTVGRDPTAAHYKFPDDPHFEIQSQGQKRAYALAKEAGRKAAWWIVEENKNLFQHKEAQPPIEAFFPSKEYTKENSSISVLNDLIDKTEVSNAITVYKILKEENIDVDKSLKFKLLELCCFYNSEDHGDERLVEEKWFFNNYEEASMLKTWKSNGFAEELFLEFEDDPQAVCTVIQGRIKYCDINAAYDLYTDACLKGISLNTGVYNALISSVYSLKQMDGERWKLVLDFLREMNEKKIPADIGTLNAGLKSLSKMSRAVLTEESVLPLLAEFKRLNVEPSLGSYYYILKHAYNRQRKLPHEILNTIIMKIHGKEHKIRHESDVYFFPFAMQMCHFQRDLPGAKLLNETLNIGKNYKLLSNDLHENKYFRDFIKLVFLEEIIDRAMETYEALVPVMYAPDYGTLETIIDVISRNGAVEYLPKMWKQIVNMDAKSAQIYEVFLNAVLANPSDDDSNEFYKDVAEKIYFLIEARETQERSALSWNSGLLTSVFRLYIRAKDLKNATIVFETAQGRSNLEMNEHALNEYLDLCIALDKPSLAIECLQYAADRAFRNTAELARKIRSEFLLDDKQIKIVSMVIESH